MAMNKGFAIPYEGDLESITPDFAKDPNNYMLDVLNDNVRVHLGGARQSVVAILRRWVDTWLDSGLKPDGTELPASRKLSMVSPTQSPDGLVQALFHFSQLYLGILPGRDGLPRIHMADSEQIFKQMKTDEDEAKFYLAMFMLTPLRDYVAKCRRDGCGRYFAIKQTNRPYPDGTICKTCVALREKRQSAHSMSGYREAAETKLYDLLAKHFKGCLEKTNWPEDSLLRRRMVEFLNREIAADDTLRALYRRASRIGITASWFSRGENQMGIADALDSLHTQKTKMHGAEKRNGVRNAKR